MLDSTQNSYRQQKKVSPLKQTPSLLSPGKSPYKSTERQQLVRHQLSQINAHLDIKKLISEIKS
jgi:hypothetical protein